MTLMFLIKLMTYSMVILDTSFLVAFFRKEDHHHAKARVLAKKHAGEQMIMTFLVMQEFMGILNRKSSTELAVKVIQLLLKEGSDVQLFKLDEANLEPTLELFGRLKPHDFSYVDVSLIHLAREFECEVLSFDQKLLDVL